MERCLSKQLLKTQTKLKNRNYVLKWNLYLYFLVLQKLLILGEKFLMSAELKGCVTWFMYILDPLQLRYNCSKFHHCGKCVAHFIEGGLFGPSWIRLRLFKAVKLWHEKNALLKNVMVDINKCKNLLFWSFSWYEKFNIWRNYCCN